MIRIAAKSAFAAVDRFRPVLRGPRILIYHQVGSGRSHEMNVTIEAFTEQIEWLRQHTAIVSLDEAIRRWHEPDSDRLTVLTFDDGYRDVYDNAFPILERHRIPFTMYLTSGPIDRPDAFPNWPGVPISWAQTAAMVESGLVTIGAHTHTHRDLRTITSVECERELESSNSMIETKLGITPDHFTYPKGWWSPTADAVVRSSYLSATLGSVEASRQGLDLHRVPRIPIQASDSLRAVQRRLTTGSPTEAWARRQLRSHVPEQSTGGRPAATSERRSGPGP